jgi:hypothetical protein
MGFAMRRLGCRARSLGLRLWRWKTFWLCLLVKLFLAWSLIGVMPACAPTDLSATVWRQERHGCRKDLTPLNKYSSNLDLRSSPLFTQQQISPRASQWHLRDRHRGRRVTLSIFDQDSSPLQSRSLRCKDSWLSTRRRTE